MKRIVRLIGIGVLAAEAVWGGGAPLSGGDNFNDNSVNWAQWSRIPDDPGRMREVNRRLYFDSRGLIGYTMASWLWDTPYALFSGDALRVSALVRVPLVTVPDNIHFNSIGLGFMSGELGTAKWLHVLAQSYNSQRNLALLAFGNGVSDYTDIVALPINEARFYLTMRYNTVTGKVTIWQQSVDRTRIFKVKTINLNTLWSLPPGASLTLRPLIHASSAGLLITPASNLYADQFAVQMIIPTL